MVARRVTVPLSDARFDTVAGYVTASYPNACVLWVDALENEALEEAFSSRLVQMCQHSDSPVAEQLLFHGTSKKNVEPIVEMGFDSGLNERSAFGVGTYLARDAAMSMRYAPPDTRGVQFMFICRALVGRMVQGITNMRLDDPCVVAVDSPSNPRIFVVPDGSMILPTFVVAFHPSSS